MITITRRLEWDALHRIPGHEGRCQAFHGHRYVAELTCKADTLDKCGRIIDFAQVKALVGGFIDEHWDHTALLWEGDSSPAAKAIAEFNAACGRPVYVMSAPPTAENLAQELGAVAQRLLSPHQIEVAAVRIYETPNCFADWTPDPHS